jgi:nitroimidazol reductase NimA-like FMN-containing flavoprotein (pyridoxamine 5'-phosphate oxidase superfamily)
MNDEEARDRLRLLLQGQPLGVLATSYSGSTHACLVAFATTDDLGELIFATSRATRKFRMLLQNPDAALLVDDRSNEVRDFRDACAATAHGAAAEVEADRLAELREIYLIKHPHLEDFVRSPSCALLSLEVEKYDLVGNFQEVQVLRMNDESNTSG